MRSSNCKDSTTLTITSGQVTTSKPMTTEPKADIGELTLRDYFAAKALQGMLANADADSLSNEAVATWAYTLADCMLKARQQ
jgi:hypothetical protein